MDQQQARTAKTFDGYKDTYSDAVDSAIAFSGLSVDFFTRAKAGYLLDVVRKHFGDLSQLAILDVGCGVGNYHALLKPHFGRIAGVDVSGACIEAAIQRNDGVEYKVYNGDELPFDDASFDVAFAICVIHHVPPAQWPKFVSEMRRVLKPGGQAIVFEHNPRNPLTMRIVNRCPFDEDAVLLRCETAVKLFEDAGFANVDGRYIFSVPAGNATLRRVDMLFARIPLGAQYFVVAEP
jgi:SAM-dependent methyltransferase